MKALYFSTINITVHVHLPHSDSHKNVTMLYSSGKGMVQLFQHRESCWGSVGYSLSSVSILYIYNKQMLGSALLRGVLSLGDGINPLS